MFGAQDRVAIDLVPHCASTPRSGWTSADELRPLAPEGFLQATALAGALGSDICGVYSSPALRCRQSVEPLAAAAGVPIEVLGGLDECHGFGMPTDWVSGPFQQIGPSIGGAWMAGRAIAALVSIARRHPESHAVACSHGDTLPIALTWLSAVYDVPLPRLVPRGGWYRLDVRDGRVSITSNEP